MTIPKDLLGVSQNLHIIVLASIAVAGPLSQTRSAGTVEGDVFARTRGSVFVIETEAGHGSGFLVDSRGFVLTNDHVLGTSPYVAVGIDIDHKYRAAIIARDPVRDIALVRVHPDAVKSLLALRFVDRTAPLSIGDRVLAIGSALVSEGSVLTTGVVSRVTTDTILADLNVNPGSSGGPLLNLDGEVVGINTFYSKAVVGAGLAGSIRVHVAESILAMMTDAALREPPAYLALPVASPRPYPAAAIRERAAAMRDPSDYRRDFGAVRIDVLTPPLVYFESHEDPRKASDDRRESYDWKSRVGSVEAIVGIRVISPPGNAFRELRLVRNGVEVVPIVPGRICEERDGLSDRQQRRCIGLYQYAPEMFAPGATLEVRVFTASAAHGHVWKLPAKLLRRVWSDFEPWLRIVGSTPLSHEVAALQH